MLVGPALKSFQSRNDTAFDGTLYWNSPELRTTAEYKILKTPSSTVVGDRGRINDDLLELDVFQEKDLKLKLQDVARSTLLEVEFPDDVKKGERVQLRLLLEIPGVFELRDPNAPRAELVCDLKYFNARSGPASDAVQILGGELWIPVVARPTKPSEGNGFTIVLYAMPGFTVGDGFSLATNALDQYTADGSQSQNRVKLIWQLDELLERDGTDPNQPLSTSSLVRLSGSFIESDDGKPIRDLQESVKSAEQGLGAAQDRIRDLKTEVRIATIVAIVGAVIAIGALLFDVLKPKNEPARPAAPATSQN